MREFLRSGARGAVHLFLVALFSVVLIGVPLAAIFAIKDCCGIDAIKALLIPIFVASWVGFWLGALRLFLPEDD